MPSPLAIFYPEGHQAHAQAGHPERPERVEAIRQALEAASVWRQADFVEPLQLSDEVLQTVHRPSLLQRLQALSAQGLDYEPETYLTPKSWQLALNAAGGAAATAAAVWRRESSTGFALSRPPGHHATPQHAMGFCLLNNVALAAEHLLQNQGARRLAILDMDVHHGNGTQDVFYARGEVLFICTHQSPLYPGSGFLNERGVGAGEGATCNLPLPPFSGDDAFDAAWQQVAIPLLDRFQPDMLLVSFGFDSHWRDPLANLQVSAAGYARQVAALKAWADSKCGGRIMLNLEGGYDLEAGAACSLAASQALLGTEVTDALGPAPQAEGERWRPVIEKAKQIWGIK